MLKCTIGSDNWKLHNALIIKLIIIITVIINVVVVVDNNVISYSTIYKHAKDLSIS